jgi:hypothetical protein
MGQSRRDLGPRVRGMKSTPHDPPRLWPASSLAVRLGVSPRWLIEQAIAGRLPGVPAGRTWLFDPEAVELSLLERARRTADAEDSLAGKEVNDGQAR